MLAISYLVSLFQPLRTAAFRLAPAVPVYIVATTVCGAEAVTPVKPALPAAGTPDWAAWALGIVLIIAVLILHRLRRRLQASEKNLARSESEWIQALDFAEDAMCLIDLDDCLVRANQAFYRFIGYTPDQAIGKRIMTLIHGEQERNACPVCQSRLERRNAVFVREAYDPMNRFRKPFEVIVNVIRDRQGEPIGIFQVLRDLQLIPTVGPLDDAATQRGRCLTRERAAPSQSFAGGIRRHRHPRQGGNRQLKPGVRRPAGL